MHTRTRGVSRRVATLVALFAMTLAGFTIPASPAQSAPYCGITWGSLPKVDARMTGAPIYNLRAGRHACFDRLVVDVYGLPVPGYRAQYVSQVIEDGSGEPIPLRGGAFIQFAVNAPAHDQNGNPTYTPANRAEAVNVTGFTTFRQVHFAGTFEGVTTIGLGVRARLPFRVFTLVAPGYPTRVVIDVAHRWTA